MGKPLLLVVALALAAAACSGDDTGSSETTQAPTTTAALRTAVDVSQVELRPVPEGGGVAQAGAEELPEGYVEEEYLMSGVAATYAGPPTRPARPTGQELDYTTRIIVRAPSDPATFSGRAFVEPFNTSGGADFDPVWLMVGPMFAEEGDVWVGVTVRTNSGVLMQEFDPVRYADVDLPLNDVGWDILRQVGGLLKEGTEQSPYPEAPAEHVYMGGYSQSGLDTATFLGTLSSSTQMEDGSPVFDGYLPAARSASLTRLQTGTDFISRLVYEPMGPAAVPVVDLESQSDAMGFSGDALGTTYTSPGGAGVRLDDSDDPENLYRLYEVAGMPHGSGESGSCDGPGSTFPNPYLVRAATDQLFRWAETGEPPPEAPRLDMTTEDDVLWYPEVDDVGNPLGGVRTPHVEVPLVTYDPQSDPGVLCKLRGRAVPLDAATLAGLYDSPEDYLDQFTASLDETIAAGFLRQEDRQAILDEADAAAQQALADR